MGKLIGLFVLIGGYLLVNSFIVEDSDSYLVAGGVCLVLAIILFAKEIRDV